LGLDFIIFHKVIGILVFHLAGREMDVKSSILDTIGNTPMVKLNNVVDGDCADIYAKLEFLNPGSSVKDRIALYIIEEAERAGSLRPGGTIVENTSGNTGVAAAMAAGLKGYKAIFTIPDKMSEEKINSLKALGAEVIVTPTDVPHDSPESYYEVAKRIVRETPNAFYMNQYGNPKNIECHYKTTGPETYRQMDGQIDYFVAGIGTGGTFSGTAKYLKEQIPDLKAIAVDPIGSIFYDYFKSGRLTEPRVYKVEGIGQDVLVGAMDFSVVDDMYRVTDKECFLMSRRLAREEGLFCGGTSGAAVIVSLKVAKEAGPGKKVVTILPDSGNRYLSKIYNDHWMKENGFLD